MGLQGLFKKPQQALRLDGGMAVPAKLFDNLHLPQNVDLGHVHGPFCYVKFAFALHPALVPVPHVWARLD